MYQSNPCPNGPRVGLSRIGSQGTQRCGSTPQYGSGISHLSSGIGTRHRRARPRPAGKPTATETLSLHLNTVSSPLRSGSGESPAWIVAPSYLIDPDRPALEHRFADR